MSNEDAQRIAALAVRQRLAYVAMKNCRGGTYESIASATSAYVRSSDALEAALCDLTLEQLQAEAGTTPAL